MVFFAAHRLSLVAESRGLLPACDTWASLWGVGFPWSTGSRAGGHQQLQLAGSVVEQGLSCRVTDEAIGLMSPDQQANSQPRNHQQSPALRWLTTVSDTASRCVGGVSGIQHYYWREQDPNQELPDWRFDGTLPSKKQTWNCEQSSLDLHYCQKAVTAGGSAAAGREGSLCGSPPAPELDSQPETLRPGKTHGSSTPSSAPHPSPRAAKGHLGTWWSHSGILNHGLPNNKCSLENWKEHIKK